jgi:hypothetical protein
LATVDPATKTGAVSREDRRGALHRRWTETKQAFKTTEFYVYLVTVVGIIIAAAVVGEDNDGADPFLADEAALYISIVTVGYLISRGLAKSGSREPYTDDRTYTDDRRH